MNVAIYARKSKATKKGESISNQIELCKKYFLNTTNEDVNFLIYEDEGWSGGNINRPQSNKQHMSTCNEKGCRVSYNLIL